MGAVAPSADDNHETVEVPEIVNPLSAVFGMLGGNDPGDFLASIMRQMTPDGSEQARALGDLTMAVGALASQVGELRNELRPIVQAFGVLQAMPKFQRAMKRTDL